MMKKNGERLNRDSRRAAIMKAAMEVLSEKGYEGATLNAIIDRVGGSKRNFYTEFGGKEGLFKTLVSEKVERQMDALKGSVPPGLRDALLDIARRIVGNFTDAEFLALYRFTLLEGSRFPEVAETFFEVAHVYGQQYIVRLIEEASQRGEIGSADPFAASEHFMSMLHGRLFYELLFGIRSELRREETESFVRSAVDLFLNGIGKSER